VMRSVDSCFDRKQWKLGRELEESTPNPETGLCEREASKIAIKAHHGLVIIIGSLRGLFCWLCGRVLRIFKKSIVVKRTRRMIVFNSMDAHTTNVRV
jgi:hypothetical protein